MEGDGKGFSLLKDEEMEVGRPSVNGVSSSGGGGRGAVNYLDFDSAPDAISEKCSRFGWKHLVLLYVLAGSAFITACVAAGKANTNADIMESELDSGMSFPTACVFGTDLVYGDEVFEYQNHYYQVIGGNGASITWKAALHDANSRCYKDNPGYLVNIGSEEENFFVWQKLLKHPSFADGNNAWIGATDMKAEGIFKWIGPKKLQTGQAFWEGDQSGQAIDDAYQNWAVSNSGTQLEPNSEGSEDCVELRSGGGHWNDNNCYHANNFFIVEYGRPTV